MSATEYQREYCEAHQSVRATEALLQVAEDEIVGSAVERSKLEARLAELKAGEVARVAAVATLKALVKTYEKKRSDCYDALSAEMDAPAAVVEEPRTKRKLAIGKNAWWAFIKHCKQTMPERFTATTKEPERWKICKVIRKDDPAAYEAFVTEFKRAALEPAAEGAAASSIA